MKSALIFGVTGQDGSYLAEILLAKGYAVYGTHRRSSVDNLVRVRHLVGRKGFTLLRADVNDVGSVTAAVWAAEPNEMYHVADQDSVGWSKDTPNLTSQVTYGGTVTVLEEMWQWVKTGMTANVFVPSSVTIFGARTDGGYDPRSPYAVAKLGVLYLCRYYRGLGLNVTCGVMGNHDGPRRGGDYLLQKIVRRESLTGNLDETVVDIGYAREYMAEVQRLTANGANRDVMIRTGNGYTISSLVRYQDDHTVYPELVHLPLSMCRDTSYLPSNAPDVLDMVLGRKGEPRW